MQPGRVQPAPYVHMGHGTSGHMWASAAAASASGSSCPSHRVHPTQGPCLTQMSLDWPLGCPPEAHRSRAGCLHQNLPTFCAAPKTPSQYPV
eukprot:scaffold11263_cov108-Isochrysis_galbana.AAC.6